MAIFLILLLTVIAIALSILLLYMASWGNTRWKVFMYIVSSCLMILVGMGFTMILM